MDIRFHNASAGDWRADCTLIFTTEGQRIQEVAPALCKAAPWLEITPALRDITGKKNEQVVLYGHPDLPLPRVLSSGLGKAASLNMQTLRDAVAKAVTACRARSYETLGIPVEVLDGLAETLGSSREELVKETVAAALLSLYRCDAYRSQKNGPTPGGKAAGKSAAAQKAGSTKGTVENAAGNDEDGTPPDPRWLALLFTEKTTPDAAHRAAREAEAEAAGIMLAQDLSNGPANYITPDVLAQRAKKLASSHGFSCTVFGPEEIRKRGMGAFWAVARGAREEPRFIVLEHCPKGKEKDAPLVLIGKGITFDTGGISLKPPAKMHEMKGDMGGAAAVLGFFAALGQMPGADELPRVVGLIPTTENMPGGNATRPGDVVVTHSGKTVEILNTDAEGRLILCDAISYAQKEYAPLAVVDIATLTGACVIALGDYGTGLFTGDKELRATLMDAAEKTGDLFWPLPLWDEYDSNLKSDVADMANIGPREGGSINAALFLRRFVEKGTRWAHLDIAGPGYVAKGSPLHPVPGGTGVGVRVFCELARHFSGKEKKKGAR